MASCSFNSNGRTFTLSVTESSYSINNNTSNVKWKLTISGGGSTWYNSYAKVIVNGQQVFNKTTSWDSGTFPSKDGSVEGTVNNIGHDSLGEKTISFSVEGYSYSYTVSSASGSLKLTKIPRVSNVSCTNANIGSNATIAISRYSNSFTHTITYTFGNLTGTIATKTGNTSITWTIPTSFYAKIPNNNSGTGTITCITYSGNTEIGRKNCGFTAYVTNSNPIFSDFTFEDINSKTLLLTDNNQTIIKGYSKIKATITSSNKAIAQNSATMSYYQLENTKGTYSSDSDVVIEANNFSNNKVNVSAVDSRGNTTIVSKNIDTFINYSSIIKDAITLSRSDNGIGKFVTLNFNGVFWNDNFGNIENTLSVEYYYKKTKDTNYITGTTTIDPTIDNNTFSFSGLIAGNDPDNGFEIQDNYDVKVIVSDELSSVTFEGIIGAGIPAIAFYGNKIAIGDKYDPSIGGTQLWGNLFANGINLDYVIESGVSNGWIYRKWKSGLAECWKKVDLTGGAYSPVWGTLYPFSAITGEINYPFTFKEIPIEVANVSRSGTNACFLYKESDGTSNTTTHTANYRPVKAGGAFANQIITISIQVVGKWK